MNYQGTINLDCIAADAFSRYLYGIGSANEGTPSKDGYTDSSVILVRSDASPANLTTLAWRVISQFEGKGFSYSYPTFTSVDCAVNVNGHFTAFFRSPYRTTSSATLLPMGIQYDPSSDTWKSIHGTSTYGWNSDMLIHKSFYSNPEATNAWHIYTNDTIHHITLGSTTIKQGLLWPDSVHTWNGQVQTFLQTDTQDTLGIASFDYTMQGFFPTRQEWYPRFIAHHRDTFFKSEGYPRNSSCPVFKTYQEGHLGEPCAFQGPTSPDGVSIQHYVFGGERHGSTFFGGIYELDSVLKVFTTENQEGRKYLEHILIQNNNASDMAVDRNFQVVGGLNPGQEPFVVALTSAGLYQFNIFGPTAGSMEGPYKVRILDDLNSLPQRVAVRLKIGKLNSYEQYQETLSRKNTKRIVEGTLGALGVMLVVGLLVWWRWRRRRQAKKEKEINDGEQEQVQEEELSDEYSNEKEKSSDPDEGEEDLSLSEGKIEVYSRGIILEDELIPDRTKNWFSDDLIAWTQPQLEGKILSDVQQQDQNRVRELILSRHPRHTFATSAGSSSADADINVKNGRHPRSTTATSAGGSNEDANIKVKKGRS